MEREKTNRNAEFGKQEPRSEVKADKPGLHDLFVYVLFILTCLAYAGISGVALFYLATDVDQELTFTGNLKDLNGFESSVSSKYKPFSQ